MKLYKVDTATSTVREVQGDGWPGKDSEGETCFENTHFANQDEAWAKLESETIFLVQFAAKDVSRMRAEVLACEKRAADAVIALDKVLVGRAAASPGPSR